MKILLCSLITLISLPVFAQLNCNNVNAVISHSVSGGTVTLTNSSVPVNPTNCITTYEIDWGDNQGLTYVYNSNAAQLRTYHTSGTYTIQLKMHVTDTLNNIYCKDSATTTATVTTSLNCNNVNAAMTTGQNGLTGYVQFNSTPVAAPKLGVSHLINWGDGSALTPAYHHTYSSAGTYTVKLYTTVHDSNNSITCVDSTSKSLMFTTPGPFKCDTVQLHFNAVTNNTYNVTVNNNSYPYIGNGINAQFIYSWGDGARDTLNTNNQVSHTYASNGTYVIKYLVTYTGAGLTCVDSTSDTVTVNYVPVNRISGKVWFDSTKINPTDVIKIWLIKFDSSTNLLTAVDSQTQQPVANTYYHFHNKAAGQYRTKAKLLNGQTSGTGYVPTYHDSALLWSNANIIAHTAGTTLGKDIYLKTGTVTAGPGFVGGNVSQGANKGTASGIDGMNILLLNTANEPVAYAVTDANGDYSFTNLPVGTYKVHPEDMNYNTTAASFTITLSHTAHIDINFERSLSQKTIVPISAGIGNVNNKASFTVYPNPATNVINIVWCSLSNDMATINITDISGKKVYQSEVKMDANAAINISNIQPGFYFMNVQTETGSNTQKLLIQ